MEIISELVSPCPNEAGPDTSPEHKDREGKVLDIIFQFRAEVILLAGIVHQDNFFHKFHRWPVDDRMDLDYQMQYTRVNIDSMYTP